MKKLFTEGKAKKVVEFKQEELEVARAVLAALNDKNTEVKVAVNSNEEVKTTRKKNYTCQTSTMYTEEQYEKIKNYAMKREISINEFVRKATMEYLENHAA